MHIVIKNMCKILVARVGVWENSRYDDVKDYSHGTRHNFLAEYNKDDPSLQKN
jgi:hypothetical protein